MVLDTKIPVDLRRHIAAAFTAQRTASDYTEKQRKEKDWILRYIERTKLVNAGENIRVSDGLVIYCNKYDYQFDREVIQSLIEERIISLHTILNLSTFRSADLINTLGPELGSKVCTAINCRTQLILRPNAN